MHATTTSSVEAIENFEPATDVPEFLRRYLTTTDKPHEIYKIVTQTKDNRVRLLTRRFFNQIQYGCKNSNCNVPTCLSYRKRVSTGPIRPYHDVTARALAIRCVEQYGNHGRDIDRTTRREKSKKKHPQLNLPTNDGLCYSEPIVPWYSDAREYLAKRNAAAGKRRPSNGTGEKDTSSREQRRITQSDHHTSPSQPNGILTQPVNAMRNSPEPHLRLNTAPDLQPQEQGFARNTSITQNTTTPDSCYPVLSAAHSDGQPKDKPTDPASFVQYLFNTTQLRLETKLLASKCTDVTPPSSESPLWISSGSSGAQVVEGTPQSTPLSDIEQVTTHKVDRRRENEFVTLEGTLSSSSLFTATQSYTFKLLPPSAILYLKSLVVRHEGSEEKPNPRFTSKVNEFVEQSLYFVFTDPDRLMTSASTWDCIGPASRESSIQELEADARLEAHCCDIQPPKLPKWTSVLSVCNNIFQISPRRQQEEVHILNHLVRLLQHAYTLPYWLSNTLDSLGQFRENKDVAHLITLVINIASAIIDRPSNRDMELNGFCVVRRNYGGVRLEMMRSSDLAFHSWLSRPEMSQLYGIIADLLAHRIALDTAIKARRAQTGKSNDTRMGMIKTLINFLEKPPYQKSDSPNVPFCSERLLEFMQAVLLTRWDRSPVIRRTSHVGGALEMLRGLYQSRMRFGLQDSWFVMHFIPDALEEIDMPFEWLKFKPDTTWMHILQFPFLFPALDLVKYFRSLNLKIMKQSHEKAMGTYANGKSQLLLAHWRVNNVSEVLDKTRPHMARYFVMTIRRENMLEDAIGQIWQRERQELTRPLKVRMGVDDGELGLDHGGVQQEFFRLAFAEALDPQYGLFDSDPTTRMSWFKLGSVEPLYKYQALGILMSLAIYNGVTVPITMPLAFYRKILDLPVSKVEHIEDGWPDLARGLKQMLEWEDGDVRDVMCRTYEFSYEAFEQRVNVDMTKKSKATSTEYGRSDGPSSSSGVEFAFTALEEAPLVTNANREAFVKDYIDHLTNKMIHAQLTSFLSGLFTLLARQSLCLFPPATLKLLFEGHPTSQLIDVDEWQNATTYEDYTVADPVIVWFWDILRNDFTQTQLRNLLEFVTASNRIPISGWGGITFIIQRNAAGNEWLPGSSTCYGRLFLPEYSSKEILREKLEKAVETSLGFGMV